MIYRLTISGRVQGVSFRKNVLNFVLSNKFPINGYVKNLPNGDVEVCAKGDEKDLQKMEEYCHRGPALAKVLNVKKEILEENQLEASLPTIFCIQY